MIDITGYEPLLLEVYPSIPNQIKDILRQFLGLTISYRSHKSKYVYTLTIHPLESNLDKLDRDYYSKRIGTQIYPLGHFGNHDLLIVSEQGHIFSAFDRWVCKYGDDFMTALENICIIQQCKSLSE